MRDTERRDRYAAAMAKRDGHPEWPTQFEDDERDYLRRADAAIAVADAELASAYGQIEARRIELLRVNERHAADRAALLRGLEARYRAHARDSVHPDFGAAYAAVANDLNRMADTTTPDEQDPDA